MSQGLAVAIGWHVQGPASSMERTEKMRPEGQVRARVQPSLESNVIQSVFYKNNSGASRRMKYIKVRLKAESVMKQSWQPELGQRQ